MTANTVQNSDGTAFLMRSEHFPDQTRPDQTRMSFSYVCPKGWSSLSLDPKFAVARELGI